MSTRDNTARLQALSEQAEQWLESKMETAPDTAFIGLSVRNGVPSWKFLGFVDSGVWDWTDEDFVTAMREVVKHVGVRKTTKGSAILTVRVVKLQWDKKRHWFADESKESYCKRESSKLRAKRACLIEGNRIRAEADRLGVAEARKRLLAKMGVSLGEAIKRAYQPKRKMAA